MPKTMAISFVLLRMMVSILHALNMMYCVNVFNCIKHAFAGTEVVLNLMANL